MLSAFSTKSTPVDSPSPNVNFNGIWVNQHESKMTLTVDADGNVSGKYITKVGAPGDEEEFDLKGFATGDLIAFTVNFGKFGSITSWTGQHTENQTGVEIKTLWHLARNVPDPQEPDNLWGAILTGADNFNR